MSIYTNTEEEYEKHIDFISLFFKYVSHWKLILASLILCVGLSVLYVYTNAPTYEVASTILMKDDQKGGGIPELNVLKEIGVIETKNNVENELEVLKTASLSEAVVRDLGLYASYKTTAVFNNYYLYGTDCPIMIYLSPETLKNINKSINFNVLVRPTGILEFYGSYYGKEFKTIVSSNDNQAFMPFGHIYIKRGDLKPKRNMEMEITLQNPTKVATEMLKNMTFELTSKNTSVVNIKLLTKNVSLGKSFLTKLVEMYNSQDINEQSAMANNTAKFIDNRLITLTEELNDVESQVENYKQGQGLTNIESEADMYIQQTGAYEQKLLDVETQLAIVTDIDNYIHKKENRFQLLPSSTGIKSENLSLLIFDYNKLLLERNRLSRIASSSNQAILTLTAQIESMFNTVQATVRNEKGSWQIAREDLLNKNKHNSARIQAIPRQEKEYTEIKRQQNIKEALFLYLLQKKEENYVKISMIEPKCKIIDKARSDGYPIAPKKTILILLSFLVGLILPIIAINIHDLMRYHVVNKDELEKITVVPVLGEILKSVQTGNVIINEKKTDNFTEMIRLLRTNLLFILNDSDKKTINVVSSIQGEGKTFVAINLAMSLALLDKKVLLIGMDIRKPKLGEYIGLKNEHGITLYLSGHIGQDQLIKSSGIHPNLSIITAGPIPPNPNELLAKPLLDKLITELRNQFDYIVLDTAPVGVVSDSFVINRFADVSLYIVRADYTHKKNIEDATILYNQKRIKNMYFVLNASQEHKNTFRYGYGKKYGYDINSETNIN